MILSRSDRLLLLIAFLALVAGFALNVMICPVPPIQYGYGVVGYQIESECASRFPIELASGVGLAVIALVLFAVRVRRRSN